MSGESPKRLLFEEFAAVGAALGSATRLELLDALLHGERSVDVLARTCGLSVSNASQHLATLLRAGLLTRRRDGRKAIYAVRDPQVVALLRSLWRVAHQNVAEIERVLERFYRQRDALEPVGRDELLSRLDEGRIVVLDVRPREEHAAGHIPSAVSIPVDDLLRRLDEIPDQQRIVAYCRGPYCVYSYRAVELLRPRGFDVRRLDGGYLEWALAELPTESSRDAAASSVSGGFPALAPDPPSTMERP